MIFPLKYPWLCDFTCHLWLLLDFGQDGFSRIFDSDFDVDTRNFSLLASVIPPYVCSFKSTEKCGHTYLHSPYEDSIMILILRFLSSHPVQRGLIPNTIILLPNYIPLFRCFNHHFSGSTATNFNRPPRLHPRRRPGIRDPAGVHQQWEMGKSWENCHLASGKLT